MSETMTAPDSATRPAVSPGLGPELKIPSDNTIQERTVLVQPEHHLDRTHHLVWGTKLSTCLGIIDVGLRPLAKDSNAGVVSFACVRRLSSGFKKRCAWCCNACVF
ncbi:hypothetical protein YC2023_091507 [Brassica napus]